MAEASAITASEPEATEERLAAVPRRPASRTRRCGSSRFDGDEIAGAVLGKIDPAENAHHGRERGIVDAVFTRRRGVDAGLARALIARALVRLRDHGMTSAYLGVDGLNPNQAMTLYGSLGFEIETEEHRLDQAAAPTRRACSDHGDRP